MDRLDELRAQIDVINRNLLVLLAKRFELCREIISYKYQHDIPMMQPHRVATVKSRFIEQAAELKIPLDFAQKIIDLIIQASCDFENDLLLTFKNAENIKI